MLHVAPCHPSPAESNRRTLYRDVPASHDVLGFGVGSEVGAGKGIGVGAGLGCPVGGVVGSAEGGVVGRAVGAPVGGVVGCAVGMNVGAELNFRAQPREELGKGVAITVVAEASHQWEVEALPQTQP